MLKDLTIVVIDSLNYDASKLALEQTLKIFPEAQVLIFSDREFYDCDTFVFTPKFNQIEHSRICLQEVGKHVTTNWALFIQFDGFPTDPEMWSEEFLKYDFIGAPFRKFDEWFVGNGGFSLRSKKLLDLTPECLQIDDGDSGMMEDQVISRFSRPWLESQGIKFPPIDLARRFSTGEELEHVRSFGFHGHHLVPYFLGKDLTQQWIKSVDLDYLLWHKNLYTFPYYLWIWGYDDQLRNWFLHADKVNRNWGGKCFEECTWRIPLMFPDQDVFELQKMITINKYTGP